MRIGIDLGGTKIEGVVLDHTGAMVDRCRVATPRGDYPATIRAIVDLVQTLEGAGGVLGGNRPNGAESVGVGIPGSVSRLTGRVKNANSVCLIGQDLAGDLARALGRPVKLANDADCFTLSEAVDGAAAGSSLVFGVILGTGVGGGIVANGRLLGGANTITGEWGHNPLPWPRPEELPGPACYCGKRGCIETFLSGPGLAASYFQATGHTLTTEEIALSAGSGQQSARETVALFEERLARALSGVINILDPQVIVLGGGVSNIGRIYRSVPKIWGRYVFSDQVDTRLVRARFGDSSGVRGAAWLGRESDGNGNLA